MTAGRPVPLPRPPTQPTTHARISLLVWRQVVHDDELLQVVLDGGLVVLPWGAEVAEGCPQARLPKDIFRVGVHLPRTRGSGSEGLLLKAVPTRHHGASAATSWTSPGTSVTEEGPLLFFIQQAPQILPGNLPCAMPAPGGGAAVNMELTFSWGARR